jgi:hypothetical protein
VRKQDVQSGSPMSHCQSIGPFSAGRLRFGREPDLERERHLVPVDAVGDNASGRRLETSHVPQNEPPAVGRHFAIRHDQRATVSACVDALDTSRQPYSMKSFG